jgi:hypothetical protein
MIGRSFEIVLGIALVVLAMRDVFDTVVVPGESSGALRVARRLLLIMLPVWKWTRRGNSGISTQHALGGWVQPLCWCTVGLIRTVTFPFGGQTPTDPAVHRRRKLKGWAITWMDHDGFHEKIGGETPVQAVAQMVGFGLRRSKMLYLSMGID